MFFGRSSTARPARKRGSSPPEEPITLTPIATYRLPCSEILLHIVRGSVLDFGSTSCSNATLKKESTNRSKEVTPTQESFWSSSEKEKDEKRDASADGDGIDAQDTKVVDTKVVDRVKNHDEDHTNKDDGKKDVEIPSDAGTTSAAALPPPSSSSSSTLFTSDDAIRIFGLDYSRSAIVNAANEGCLGGAGVDGAISDAGGDTLHRDRLALPVLRPKQRNLDDGDSGGRSVYHLPVRCRTGEAVMTGPNWYGSIRVPYVIHAVGPNYWDYDVGIASELRRANRLLRDAYIDTLDAAHEANLNKVAFCLLSAGIFRGQLPLSRILYQALLALRRWTPPVAGDDDNGDGKIDNNVVVTTSLREVTICAFTRAECDLLLDLCDEYLEGAPRPAADKGDTEMKKNGNDDGVVGGS